MTDGGYGMPGDVLPTWLELEPPRSRSLQVYALDPNVGSYVGNRITIQVPWEPLLPGPAGAKIAVVDYDAGNDCYYPPVDLEHPLLLARQGLDPTESDPRFHQQMVYAVASRTIEMFESALGRDIRWRRHERGVDPNSPAAKWHKTGDIEVLHLYPHAMHEANAYYSPDAHGIVFGYFCADTTNPGRNLPDQRIFTCLSPDIIAHEMTHAIIDGIRTYFTEPTNPDVLAFHEAFADLCALFAHFSLKETLVDAIRRTGGRLHNADLAAPSAGSAVGAVISPADAVIGAELRPVNPLIQLAVQFGQARGGQAGLRSAIGVRPTPEAINTRIDDAHFRGSILVSAVFDAYFSVYLRRAEGLFEIYLAGGGERTDDLPVAMAERLAAIASDTATFFFQLCARALDYCPPVDITFGDFLRALITVARDVRPDDEGGVRDSLMEAFRLRGIYPEGSEFFSEDALVWPQVPPGTLPPVDRMTITHPQTRAKVEAGLIFGLPSGLSRDEKDVNGAVLRAWVAQHAEALGLDAKQPISIPSFHSVFRVEPNGRTRVEMIVEVVQSTTAEVEPGLPQFGAIPFRGGATLVINGPRRGRGAAGSSITLPPEVRFVIGKALSGVEGQKRWSRQRGFAVAQGTAFVGGDGRYEADFRLLHEGGR